MKYILGIDMGTSSVKLKFDTEDGVQKQRVVYDEISPRGFWEAVCRGARSMDLRGIRAVSLTSQVGTYIADGETMLSWKDKAGAAELGSVLGMLEREEAIREISMPHPMIASYPLPRLIYIKNNFEGAKKIGQPKDYLCEALTGNFVSDRFSFRGLANLESGKYSETLLDKFGLSHFTLPKLMQPASVAGYITKEASAATGIPEETRVVVGCNDFFAGLLGMGIWDEGDAFDITGTSEHLGYLRSDLPQADDGLVAGGYFNLNVHYGVTASSGVSLAYGRSFGNIQYISAEKALANTPPIFLPYLSGERAPIWDPAARGVFFGIKEGCTHDDMAYAVAEGVCFSMYHIYETMKMPTFRRIVTSGGAAKEPLLCRLKASLFGVPLVVCEEEDASVLGAQMIASVALGDHKSLRSVMREVCVTSDMYLPDAALRATLLRRFGTYRALYPALKAQMREGNL